MATTSTPSTLVLRSPTSTSVLKTLTDEWTVSGCKSYSDTLDDCTEDARYSLADNQHLQPIVEVPRNPQPTSPGSFFCLPPEIRLNIYKWIYLVPRTTIFECDFVGYGYGDLSKHFRPSLDPCQPQNVCKEFRSELLELYSRMDLTWFSLSLTLYVSPLFDKFEGSVMSWCYLPRDACCVGCGYSAEGYDWSNTMNEDDEGGYSLPVENLRIIGLMPRADAWLRVEYDDDDDADPRDPDGLMFHGDYDRYRLQYNPS